MKYSIDLTVGYHACGILRAYTDGLQSRSQSFIGNTAIQTRDHTNLWIGKRGDHSLQIVRLNSYVAVVDNQVVITRRWKHLRQIADLAVRPQVSVADNKLD